MAAYAVVFNEISISKSDKISDIERRDEYPITPTACAAAGRASGEARGPVQRTRGPARGNAHTARAHALWPLTSESRNLHRGGRPTPRGSRIPPEQQGPVAPSEHSNNAGLPPVVQRAVTCCALACKPHISGSNVQRPTSVICLPTASPCARARCSSASTRPRRRCLCYAAGCAKTPSAFASSNARRAAALGQMLVLVKVCHVLLLRQVLFERGEVAQLFQLVGATGQAGLLLHR